MRYSYVALLYLSMVSVLILCSPLVCVNIVSTQLNRQSDSLLGKSYSLDLFIQLYKYALVAISSRKHLRTKVTSDLHLTYSKNGGNLGLVLNDKKWKFLH